MDFGPTFSFFGQPTAKIIAIKTREKNLLDLIRKGDQQALKTIFMALHQELCRVAWRVLHDEEKAKDIVQDVFLKFWLKRNEIDITTSLSAYLKRAVVNTAINALQHFNTVPIEADEVSDNALHISADASASQELDELHALAGKAIDRLPSRTRAVFQLIRTEGMSYREVSEHLNISEKAVEKEMMRALKLLRVALKDYLVVMIFLKIFL